MSNTIFSAASVLLPPYDANDPEWHFWSVIACDQFTSEPSYWEQVEAEIDTHPSTCRLMLPEAWLGTDKEQPHQQRIFSETEQIKSWLKEYPDAYIYVERTLPDGTLRKGIVGKFDLEAYSYEAASSSPIRATEATVLTRIPPRCAIRRKAVFEMPHIMVFYNDHKHRLQQLLEQKKGSLPLAYRTELMQGGGSLSGYVLQGTDAAGVTACIQAYEAETTEGMPYAVGDGNHSLAAAKAYYEELKTSLGEVAAKNHPARYALAELVALDDPAIVFEPIYRIVRNCDPEDLMTVIASCTTEAAGEQQITILTEEGEQTRSFAAPTHPLTVGTLQNVLDAYLAAHPDADCDYIHDKSSLFALAKQPQTVGFYFDGMKKEELFPSVQAQGSLPRKTFSMGEARSKRYYMELRKITL